MHHTVEYCKCRSIHTGSVYFKKDRKFIMALWSSTTNAMCSIFKFNVSSLTLLKKNTSREMFEYLKMLILTRFLLFHRTSLTEEWAENQREYFITRCLGLSKIRFQWQHIKWDVNYCLSKRISDVMEGYVRQFLIQLEYLMAMHGRMEELFASVRCWIRFDDWNAEVVLSGPKDFSYSF